MYSNRKQVTGIVSERLNLALHWKITMMPEVN